MQLITKDQLKKLHVLLSQLGLMDEKKEMVKHVTNSRTESSRELTIHEAGVLITALAGNDGCERMRKKVIALAYEANIIYGNTPEDKQMNAAKLNKFLLERGTVKKNLPKLTHGELVKTITQFQQIIKHQGEGKAAKATNALLKELNITSSIKTSAKAL